VEEVKAYIESGILELYVLGQLPAQENAEVEAMANKHPEIKAELLSIETALEVYALENAIAPSAELGNQILSKLTTTSAGKAKKSTHTPKIVPLYEETNEIKVKVLRYALVACIALLVVCAASLYSLNNQLHTAHQQIVSLSTERDQFTKTVSRLEFEKAGMENRIAMTETEEWTTIRLAGTKTSPEAKMLVYWNKNNKNILINYAAIDLPKTDKRHEYQLWALVDGKPVSLGVFGSDENATKAVKEMETIQKAQAFAVTIEPMGGSANPTMEKMVVMGAI
jgi:anti-sigma-K factor RskA